MPLSRLRQSAYEIAVLNAQVQLIEYKNLSITCDALLTIDKDDSLPSAMHELEGKDEKAKAQVLQDKMAALADADLDTRLKSLGVDPSQFNNKPKAEKIPLLTRNSIARRLRKQPVRWLGRESYRPLKAMMLRVIIIWGCL